MMLKENKDFVRWAGGWFVVYVAISIVYIASPLTRDSSDEKGWGGSRSGMSIHRDKLTGCQYLGLPGGGITPRMLHGKHMGCEQAMTETEQLKESK